VPNPNAVVLVGNGGRMRNISVARVLETATFLLNSTRKIVSPVSTPTKPA